MSSSTPAISFAFIVCFQLFTSNFVHAGFSREVCNSTDPTDTVSDQPLPVLTMSTDESPFKIKLLSQPYYRIKKRITVQLEGGPFTEFILQARKLGVANTVTRKHIGLFLEPLPSDTQFLNCDEKKPQSTITHITNSTKKDLIFTWEAPDSDQGSFEFIATIMNGSTYWKGLKSEVVNFRQFPPALTDCGKDVGCFVHITNKDEDCVKGGCDVIVKSRMSHDGKIANFMIGRKTPKDGGFVGIGFADDKEDMKEMVMIACIKHFNSFVIKSYYMQHPSKGFVNTTAFISAPKHHVGDDMMWCQFQFQLSNTYPIDKDISKPKYRVYLTGNLNDDHFPEFNNDKVLVSEEPMSLGNRKFIEYTGDSAAHRAMSSISCVIGVLFFMLLR